MKSGTWVSKGAVIGAIGGTGDVTASHLYFEGPE
ncbi:hypothetical protein [Xanthovirga aplysinae]